MRPGGREKTDTNANPIPMGRRPPPRVDAAPGRHETPVRAHIVDPRAPTLPRRLSIETLKRAHDRLHRLDSAMAAGGRLVGHLGRYEEALATEIGCRERGEPAEREMAGRRRHASAVKACKADDYLPRVRGLAVGAPAPPPLVARAPAGSVGKPAEPFVLGLLPQAARDAGAAMSLAKAERSGLVQQLLSADLPPDVLDAAPPAERDAAAALLQWAAQTELRRADDLVRAVAERHAAAHAQHQRVKDLFDSVHALEERNRGLRGAGAPAGGVSGAGGVTVRASVRATAGAGAAPAAPRADTVAPVREEIRRLAEERRREDERDAAFWDKQEGLLRAMETQSRQSALGGDRGDDAAASHRSVLRQLDLALAAAQRDFERGLRDLVDGELRAR